MENETEKNTSGHDMTTKKIVKNRLIFLIATLLLGIILAGATVYGVMPAISLNSPTSFPVDI